MVVMNDAQREQRTNELLGEVARAERLEVEADGYEERGWLDSAAIAAGTAGAAYTNAAFDALALQDFARSGKLFALSAGSYERAIALSPTPAMTRRWDWRRSAKLAHRNAARQLLNLVTRAA